MENYLRQPFQPQDYSQPTQMYQSSYPGLPDPGQFQPPLPPKKRNRGCMIFGIIGGILAALLLSCGVLAAILPPPPKTASTGANQGSLVVAITLTPTQEATTATLAQTPTPTAIPSPIATIIPTPTLAPTVAPTPIPPTATPVPTLAPSPTQAPAPVPTKAPAPPPPPTPKPAPTQPPAKTGINGNPWGYDFSAGSYIYSPQAAFCSYFACIDNFWNGHGYVMQCVDGMYGKSGGIRGSCSGHGGNSRPLYSH